MDPLKMSVCSVIDYCVANSMDRPVTVKSTVECRYGRE